MTAALILGTAALLCWLFTRQGASVVQPAAALTSPSTSSKHKVVKVNGNKDWQNTSEAELREFTSLFGKTVPTSFNMEARLQPGEALLADAFEASPGVFVFSKITPMRKTLDDGSSVIEASLECFSISLAGEHRQIMHRISDLKPRGVYTNAALTDHGVYSITASADSGYEGGEILLKASGGFHSRTFPSSQRNLTPAGE
jgi:hypothetical protein